MKGTFPQAGILLMSPIEEISELFFSQFLFVYSLPDHRSCILKRARSCLGVISKNYRFLLSNRLIDPFFVSLFYINIVQQFSQFSLTIALKNVTKRS